MAGFLLKRLATLIATLWATSVIVFLVLEILPGDPALLALGIDASDAQLAAFRAQYNMVSSVPRNSETFCSSSL